MLRVLVTGLALILSFALAASAATNTAPQDAGATSYVLVAPNYRGIAEGVIPPAHTILSIDGDTLQFTFASYTRGDQMSCEAMRKCSRFVNALTLEVTRDLDNEIRIVGAERPDSNAIFRPEMDDIYRGQIANALDGARMAATPRGMTFHGEDVTLRFVEGGRATVDQAFALADAFMVRIADADLCLIRQLATFATEPPTPAQSRVLTFAALAADLDALRAAAAEGGDKQGDPPTVAARLAHQIAIYDGARPLLENGWEPIDDAALDRMIAKGLEEAAPLPLDDGERAALAEELNANRDALAASAEMIGASLRVEGDLLESLCRDLTLGLP